MGKLRALFTAIMVGLKDGWDQPGDLSMGMTWDEDNYWANGVYDRSVNFGQRLKDTLELG